MMVRPPRLAVLAALAGGLVAAGCAPTLPKGHWDARARSVCAGQVCYIVGPLDGDWRMVHQSSASAGWYDDRSGGVIETNASCREDAESAPLAALTRELLVGYTERRVTAQEIVPMQGREALRSHVIAKLDGVPMELEVYVLRRNGCVFDLAYAAPPASFAVGQREFQRFVVGFTDARTPAQAAAALRAGS